MYGQLFAASIDQAIKGLPESGNTFFLGKRL
ncbi:hypothetical protein D047_3675A, partial [Vibrio parahaemolyticus VPTS-2010_2]